jgi:uncharacterized delta-60 repeat protein
VLRRSLPVILAVAAVVGPASRAAARDVCPDGYYRVTGRPLVAPTLDPGTDMIVVEGGRILLWSGCPATRAMMAGTRQHTAVAARWARSECVALKHTRLRARILHGCRVMRGTVTHRGNGTTRRVRFRAVRTRPPGGLVDVMFGSAGTASLTEGMGSALAVQPDGAVVVAGRGDPDREGRQHVMLVRWDRNGTLDSTFGRQGVVGPNLGLVFGAQANAVVLQPDGKIVAGGTVDLGDASGTHDTAFLLVRYRPDGTLDTGFGTSGVVITQLGPGADRVFALALAPDGGIVAAGSTAGPTSPAFALARYDASGMLDAGFGIGGVVIADEPSAGATTVHDDALGAVAVAPDGRIVAAGSSVAGADESFASPFVVARWLPDGTLDPTFGDGGFAATHFATRIGRPTALALGPDGGVTVAGRLSQQHVFRWRGGLAGWDASGAPDPGLAGKGRLEIRAGEAMAVQADGKLLVAGKQWLRDELAYASLLQRFTPDGALDPEFGDDGVVRVDEEPRGVAVAPDGRIVVLAGRGFGVQRLWP